jgi:hypothetical protein
VRAAPAHSVEVGVISVEQRADGDAVDLGGLDALAHG